MPPENWQSAPPSYPNNNPPTSPPPQIPSPPYNAVSGLGPSAQPELASQYIKPRRRWIVPMLAGAGVVVVAAAAVLIVQAYRNNPATIFNQALSNSLATKQIQESVSSDVLNTILVLDTNNPKGPRVSTLTTKSLGANTYVKGYGSLQNTYISYASDPTNSTTTPTNLLDQWIQVRSGGSLPAGVTLNPLFTASDPRYQVVGSWMFGGFSGKDRSGLLKLAKSSKLYQIDALKIAQTNIDDHAALVYSLSVNGDKLAAYEVQAGVLFGIAKSDVATITQGLSGTTIGLKVYIQKDIRQVVRVDTTVRGLTTRVTYSGFNTAKLAAEPKANLSYSEYLKQLGS